MTANEIVLLPKAALERLQAWGAHWGTVDYRYDVNDGVIVVTGSSNAEKVRYGIDDFTSAQDHYLQVASVRDGGLWYQSDSEASVLNAYLRATGLTIHVDGLKAHVPDGWKVPPIHHKQLVLTRSTVDEAVAIAGWAVSGDIVAALDVEVVTESPAAVWLSPQWPTSDLREERVVLVGCGSIGSTIAYRLASAGIGRISLVDPDRLLERNVIRHELSRRHLGRHKVVALRDELLDRYPDLLAEAFPRDAVSEADYIRPVIADASIVLCATDGVESRRVVNHLARAALVAQQSLPVFLRTVRTARYSGLALDMRA